MEKFESDDVLSDMKIKMPAALLQIHYGTNDVQPGKILTPTQVQTEPTVNWDADPNAFYTVVMNDLDPPSRKEPKYREVHHWCVVNIPGHNVAEGEVLTEYIGSGPPQDTGLHRYVFLAFKQPTGRVQFNENHIDKRTKEGRFLHSMANFAAKHSLGDPVAGNYYQAEWDDYVPKLHEQLNAK